MRKISDKTAKRYEGKKGGPRVGGGRKPGVTTRQETKPGVGGFAVLTDSEERRYWRKVVRLAIAKQNLEAVIRALIYINEMQRGRPYQATNPAYGAGLMQDPRLTAHIKNLIPSVTVNMAPEPKQIEASSGAPSEVQENQLDNSLGAQGAD